MTLANLPPQYIELLSKQKEYALNSFCKVNAHLFVYINKLGRGSSEKVSRAFLRP
jgi:hypothetical protein